jgi:hypothetical protein
MRSDHTYLESRFTLSSVFYARRLRYLILQFSGGLSGSR